MHNRIVNKTRYDDPGKPIKQTSFTVKNLWGNLPEKHFTIVKWSFRSSTKPLSLDSIIPVDELTAKTSYRFRTSELFNIWTPSFCCTDPSSWHIHQFEEDCWLQSSSLHQQWKSRSTWLQNPKMQRRSNFFLRELGIGHLLHMFSLYSLLWQPLK